MKNAIKLILGCLIFLTACISEPFQPTEEDKALAGLVYNDVTNVWKYSFNQSFTTPIYTTPSGWSIGGVAVAPDGTVFITRNSTGSLENVAEIISISNIGEQKLILRYEKPEYTFIGNIWISPNNKYLLFRDSFNYNFNIRSLELATGRLANFEIHYAESYDEKLICWGEDGESVYFQVRNNGPLELREYNIVYGTYVTKETLNIRTYVPEYMLIEQGVVGDRFDFTDYLGIDLPDYDRVLFHPNGSGFVFLRERQIWYCELNSGEVNKLIDVPQSFNPIDFFDGLQILWNDNINTFDLHPNLNDEDKYYTIDETSLGNIAGLNESIVYSIYNNSPPQRLKFSWQTQQYTVRDFFVIRGPLEIEKFHAAESHLIGKIYDEVFYNQISYGYLRKSLDFLTPEDAIISLNKKNEYNVELYSELSTYKYLPEFENILSKFRVMSSKIMALDSVTEKFLKTFNKEKYFADLSEIFPDFDPEELQGIINSLNRNDKEISRQIRSLLSRISNFLDSERMNLLLELNKVAKTFNLH